MSRLIAFTTRYLYAAISCLYLFTLGVLSEKNRLLISSICSHFGYTEKRPAALLPSVEVSELVPEDIPIQIREPIEADGNISLTEIAVISKLIKAQAARHRSSKSAPSTDEPLSIWQRTSLPDARIYTLDLPERIQNRVANRPRRGKIHRQRNLRGTIHRHRLRAENNSTLRRFGNL